VQGGALLNGAWSGIVIESVIESVIVIVIVIAIASGSGCGMQPTAQSSRDIHLLTLTVLSVSVCASVQAPYA
jgi:hypothetical protein